MNPQFESQFQRGKRPGDVVVQWRNKQDRLSREKLDRRWHHYKFMTEPESVEFMRDCAPTSSFFEYRVIGRA